MEHIQPPEACRLQKPPSLLPEGLKDIVPQPDPGVPDWKARSKFVGTSGSRLSGNSVRGAQDVMVLDEDLEP